MSVPNHSTQVATYFDANKHKYNFETVEGCGTYTEDCVRECLQPLDIKWGLLKYNGPGTKYNGHRIDSILYSLPFDGDTNLRSIDIIVAAESNHASSGWSIDEVARYTINDWLFKPQSTIPVNTVPWVGYNENSFERLKKMLKHDYERRPQGADFDVSVWAGRFFHNCYMGPNKTPLGEQAALERVKPELCAALKIPVDDYYGE